MLRAMVVGAGPRGQDWLDALEADPRWAVAGAVESNDGAAGTAVARLGADRVHATIDDALAASSVDAAIIATPVDQHVEPAARLLRAGVPVLVEKPLTTSLREARMLVDTAAEASVPLLVGMNYRYMRSHRTAKKVVDSGVLGHVGIVTAQYLRPPHDMAASLASVEHQILWGMAIHHLDAIRYVLGREATGVFARSYTAPWNDAPVGASFQALLELEGGTRVTYSATYESSGHGYFGAGQEFYERLTGQKATLHVFHRWLFISEGRRFPRPVRRGRREVTEERVLLGKLAAAIEDGVEPDCSGADNLHTIAITDACLQSIAEDRWVDPRLVLDGG